jgi:hypothetical protein
MKKRYLGYTCTAIALVFFLVLVVGLTPAVANSPPMAETQATCTPIEQIATTTVANTTAQATIGIHEALVNANSAFSEAVLNETAMASTAKTAASAVTANATLGEQTDGNTTATAPRQIHLGLGVAMMNTITAADMCAATSAENSGGPPRITLRL